MAGIAPHRASIVKSGGTGAVGVSSDGVSVVVAVAGAAASPVGAGVAGVVAGEAVGRACIIVANLAVAVGRWGPVCAIAVMAGNGVVVASVAAIVAGGAGPASRLIVSPGAGTCHKPQPGSIGVSVSSARGAIVWIVVEPTTTALKIASGLSGGEECDK